jgi:hypothetical protein
MLGSLELGQVSLTHNFLLETIHPLPEKKKRESVIVTCVSGILFF